MPASHGQRSGRPRRIPRPLEGASGPAPRRWLRGLQAWERRPRCTGPGRPMRRPCHEGSGHWLAREGGCGALRTQGGRGILKATPGACINSLRSVCQLGQRCQGVGWAASRVCDSPEAWALGLASQAPVLVAWPAFELGLNKLVSLKEGRRRQASEERRRPPGRWVLGAVSLTGCRGPLQAVRRKT